MPEMPKELTFCSRKPDEEEAVLVEGEAAAPRGQRQMDGATPREDQPVYWMD